MKLYLCIAAVLVALVFAPQSVLAECTTQTVYVDGKVMACKTCCLDGRCSTICF